MKPRLITKLQLMSLIVTGVTGLCANHCLADVVCVANSGSTKRICLEWGKQTDPVQNVDFSVDYTCQGCSDAPAVELSTGDLAWVVYSEVISTGAPANIGALTTTDSDNYGVKIAKGSAAGAANVTSMVLTPSGDHYSSLASGSRISGNLTGDLTLQKTSGYSGGNLHVTIDGDAEGDITVYQVSSLTISGDALGSIETLVLYPSLTISGDLLGRIDVTGLMALADLTVSGDVGPDASIEIADIYDGSLTIGENLDGAVTIDGPVDGLTFTVAESVTSTGGIQIGEMVDASLHIGALDDYADITVTGYMDGGDLTVSNVGEYAIIDIADMEGSTTLNFPGAFAGHLDLRRRQ